MEPQTESAESPRRRFLIADAMMLVAIVALMATASTQFRWMWEGIPDASYSAYQLNRLCVGVALANASVARSVFLVAPPLATGT